MSDFEPVKREKLSFIQRALLTVTLWPAFFIVAFGMPVEYFISNSQVEGIARLALLVGILLTGRFLELFLKRGPFRAGMAVMFFGLFNGIALLSLLAVSLVDEVRQERRELEARWAHFGDENFLHNESHLEFGTFALGGLRSQESPFNQCIEEFHRRSDTRSMRREAIKLIQSYIDDESLAEDAVHDVMLKVCLKFEEGKVEELRPYFFKAVNNARRDLQKKKTRESYCEIKHSSFRSPDPRQEQLQLVQAAMCRIDPRKANVLRRKASGESYQRIASSMGISYSNARQLYSRGVAELKIEVEKLSN